MTIKHVWGCILCVLGTLFVLGGVANWMNFLDVGASQEAMNQLDELAFGESGSLRQMSDAIVSSFPVPQNATPSTNRAAEAAMNSFREANKNSLKPLADAYQSRAILLLILGVISAVAGTLMLKKSA
jgi:hypothetical protein